MWNTVFLKSSEAPALHQDQIKTAISAALTSTVAHFEIKMDEYFVK